MIAAGPVYRCVPAAKLSSPATVRDEPAPAPALTREAAPALTEEMLVRLWSGQRYPAAALVTRQGVVLRVLHPGQRGRGPGPDFRNAIVAAPAGGLLRGDVELHVKASDFNAHGHGGDPRYNRVCLHVVFEDDAGEDTRLANGRRVPVVALAPWMRRRAAELSAWLASPRLWREPCHDAVVRLGEAGVAAALEELGERRFRERERELAVHCAERGPGEALYRALLAGLAYGGASELPLIAGRLPWRELADRLKAAPPADRLELAEALLLGAAGLLPSQLGGVPRHPYEEALERRWQSERREVPDPAASAAHQPARPANHPARRLAGLARVLVGQGMSANGIERVDDLLRGPPARLVAAWTVPAAGYWRERIAPGAPAGRPGALIGRSRAIELLVNAVLPWAAAVADERGDRDGAERARACYRCLPRPGRYGALAFLETNLRAGERPLRLDARRQQGLLALYKTECTQGGCGRCVLS